METIYRVNFLNPTTNINEVGFGIKGNKTWTVRNFKKETFEVEINASFESYKKSNKFVEQFFNLN